MLLRLILLFTLLPLVELVLLLRLWEATNLLTTVAIVVATGVLGAALARQQGLQTWRRIQEHLSRGDLPAGELLDGLLILLAGAVLITPGLLTDVCGFALLAPAVRRRLGARLREWFRRRTTVQVYRQRPDGTTEVVERRGEAIIDAEFTREPAEEDADSQRLRGDERSERES